MKKAAFVFNPVAGKGVAKQHLFAIINALTAAGYLVTVYPTQCQGDGMAFVRTLPAQELLVVSGGDGTLREIVSGYLLNPGLDCPIGYLPAGTTNDFAGTLGLSKSFERNIPVLTEGEAQVIDVGRFNRDYFVYVAAFGVFTDVPFTTPQANKNLLGYFAYILEGVTKLSQIKSYHCRVRYDQQVLEGEFILGIISNSDSIGGMKRRSVIEAQLADGLFEVMLVKKPESLGALTQIISEALNGRFNSENLIMFQTNRLEIIGEEAIQWTLDGEDGGVCRLAEICTVPQAVKIIS